MLHLDVAEAGTAYGVSRAISLRKDDGSQLCKFCYEISGHNNTLDVFDGFVFAVLFRCMKEGLPVRVHGDISESCAYNVRELQRAWHKWRGDQYAIVDMVPDRIRACEPVNRKVVQAFSGGVDACFTLINNDLLKGKGGLDISAAVLVHGFDVDHEEVKTFGRLRDLYEEKLDGYGVKLETVRTDSKIASFQDWDDSSGIQLAACLHNFSDQYGIGVLGSSEPYEALIIPWGSSPITDHLFSGDVMSIIHDGAGYSRTEKVEVLNDHLEDLSWLRVCWAGKEQDRNCGKCEKCLRTRMNFAAVGNRNPACFPTPFDDAMLENFRPDIKLHISEVEGILRYVNSRGSQKGFARNLRKAIAMGYAYWAAKKAVRKVFSRSKINAIKRMLGKS